MSSTILAGLFMSGGVGSIVLGGFQYLLNMCRPA